MRGLVGIKTGDQILLTGERWDDYKDHYPGMHTGAVLTVGEFAREDAATLVGIRGTWSLLHEYEIVSDYFAENKPMRFLIAIEGYRGTPTSFIDIPEEMLLAHPELTFKMGEVIGLFFKLGGKETRGEE